jgi:hypothetical protein
MRTHAWLNTETLGKSFSVQVREPALKVWAHVYEDGKGISEKQIKMFDDEPSAQAYIRSLKEQPV